MYDFLTIAEIIVIAVLPDCFLVTSFSRRRRFCDLCRLARCLTAEGGTTPSPMMLQRSEKIQTTSGNRKEQAQNVLKRKRK
jgi:hypothetical protein